MPKNEFETGLRIYSEMLGQDRADAARTHAASGRFGAAMAEAGVRTVFANYWDRPGLDRRSRSLITLGVLVMCRQADKIREHTRAAIKHGLTPAEIEEAMIHACAYAGWPAGSAALEAAGEELRSLGLID